MTKSAASNIIYPSLKRDADGNFTEEVLAPVNLEEIIGIKISALTLQTLEQPPSAYAGIHLKL